MKPIKNESPFPKVQLPLVPYTLKWSLFFKLCSRIAGTHLSSFFNPLQMNKFATGLASVLILSVAGWGVFQFGITTTYQDHVSNAQAALTELDTFAQTGTVALTEPMFEIIPTAHAEGDEVENRYVRDLVSTVVHETELAIEKVEDSRDPVDVEEALDIIDELQDDKNDVLDEVVDVVDDDEVLDDVAAFNPTHIGFVCDTATPNFIQNNIWQFTRDLDDDAGMPTEEEAQGRPSRERYADDPADSGHGLDDQRRARRCAAPLELSARGGGAGGGGDLDFSRRRARVVERCGYGGLAAGRRFG